MHGDDIDSDQFVMVTTEVLKRCYSTVGYLEKLTASFNLYFVARTTEYSSFSEDKPLKAFLFKGKELKKWIDERHQTEE